MPRLGLPALQMTDGPSGARGPAPGIKSACARLRQFRIEMIVSESLAARSVGALRIALTLAEGVPCGVALGATWDRDLCWGLEEAEKPTESWHARVLTHGPVRVIQLLLG